jgi:hypothetical protein
LIFEAIVNGIFFLCSYSVSSLLVYRKAHDFCKWILHLATLLKVSRSFQVEFLWSFKYKIMSSVSGDSLTTLPICIPFISSSCLIAQARNSKTKLIGLVRKGTLVSFLTLGEMVSVFPH